MKHHYQKELEQKEWKQISFCLPWLEAEDYPVLLGKKKKSSHSIANYPFHLFKPNKTLCEMCFRNIFSINNRKLGQMKM